LPAISSAYLSAIPAAYPDTFSCSYERPIALSYHSADTLAHASTLRPTDLQPVLGAERATVNAADDDTVGDAHNGIPERSTVAATIIATDGHAFRPTDFQPVLGAERSTVAATNTNS